MSKKIVHKFFHYASQAGATNFIVSSQGKKIILDYNFSGGERRSFSLSQENGQDLITDLRQILHIKPGELVNSQPARLVGTHGRLNFQVTIVPDNNQEKIIINLLDSAPHHWQMNQLGLSTGQKKEIQSFLKRPSGLLIISSPAGHGKSATAFALGEEINSPEKNIYALEDFPEANLDGINFLKQTPANWARVLGHDSDIIIADSLEVKDNLDNALRAASTGRLVIGTMAAANSFEVLARVLKSPLPLKLKLDNLKMIINQRLASLAHQPKHSAKKLRQAIGLFEVLKITPELKRTLAKETNLNNKKFWTKLINQIIANGFQPLEFDRQKKLKERIIKS